MMLPPRRQWLKNIGKVGLGAIGSQFFSTSYAQRQEVRKSGAHGDVQPLALKDYQPKSMLHVPETRVERARFLLDRSKRQGRCCSSRSDTC